MLDVNDLVKMITSDKTKRSRQEMIGPSEIGGCRRRFWYRVNKQTPTNDQTLSLAAWMGTAIHSRIESELRKQDPWAERYEIEVEVENPKLLGVGLRGHVDLYVPADRLVVDWKTTTKKNLSKFPSQQQRWQVQLYGYLLNGAGRPVDEVALVAIARDGNENDVVMHREPYSQEVAENALEWAMSVLEDADLPPADMPVYFCRDYCKFYDPSGYIGCEGKK